jgi:hypothetical protein
VQPIDCPTVAAPAAQLGPRAEAHIAVTATDAKRLSVVCCVNCKDCVVHSQSDLQIRWASTPHGAFSAAILRVGAFLLTLVLSTGGAGQRDLGKGSRQRRCGLTRRRLASDTASANRG